MGASTGSTLGGLLDAERVYQKATGGRSRDARQKLHNARRAAAPQTKLEPKARIVVRYGADIAVVNAAGSWPKRGDRAKPDCLCPESLELSGCGTERSGLTEAGPFATGTVRAIEAPRLY
jgi:hypothetical protein